MGLTSLRKLQLRTKYRILKQVVIVLGLFEYLGLGGGLYFAGARQFQESVAFFALMGISYYVSSNLSYKVLEYLIRLEGGKNAKNEEGC